MHVRWSCVLFLLVAAPLSAQVDSRPSSSPTSRPAADAARLAGEIKAEVAALRGLPPLGETKTGVYSEAELRAFITAEFARELPAPRLDFLSRAWKALELIPPDFDLRRGYLELLTDQIAGFYDPRTKELRLVARESDPATEGLAAAALRGMSLDEITMAHELVHALQDAAFGLTNLPLDVPEDDDLALAARSLVEGDAVAVMMAYMFRKTGTPVAQIFNPTVARAAVGAMNMDSLPGGQALRTAPPLLRETLIFPYVQGLSFCLALASPARSFAPLDAAFARPPTSTEQILHPEKAAGPEFDAPQDLAPPPLAPLFGERYAVAGSNVLGELGVRTWLDAPPDGASRAERRAIRNAATAAARGWDGDRYVLYVAPDAPDVLVFASVWDSPEDAAEAGAAILARFPAAEPDAPATIAVRVAGDRVFAVRGAGPTAAARAFDALERELTTRSKPASRPTTEPK